MKNLCLCVHREFPAGESCGNPAMTSPASLWSQNKRRPLGSRIRRNFSTPILNAFSRRVLRWMSQVCLSICEWRGCLARWGHGYKKRRMNVTALKNCRRRTGAENSGLLRDKLKEAVRVKRPAIDLLPQCIKLDFYLGGVAAWQSIWAIGNRTNAAWSISARGWLGSFNLTGSPSQTATVSQFAKKAQHNLHSQALKFLHAS